MSSVILLDIDDLTPTLFCLCPGNSEPIPFIDSSTPLHARVLNTVQDIAYELVFSDEFTQNGRLFSDGTLLVSSITINLLPPISSDRDPMWEAACSSDSDLYASQINTKDGSLSLRLDNLQPQGRDRHRDRYNENECREDQLRQSGWGWGLGGWKGGDGAKERSAIYTDRSLSGILKMKVPVCLSRGGLVEVGLGKRNFGPDSWLESGLKREGVGKWGKPEEVGSTLKRLIYVRTLSSFLFNSTYPSLLPS